MCARRANTRRGWRKSVCSGGRGTAAALKGCSQRGRTPASRVAAAHACARRAPARHRLLGAAPLRHAGRSGAAHWRRRAQRGSAGGAATHILDGVAELLDGVAHAPDVAGSIIKHRHLLSAARPRLYTAPPAARACAPAGRPSASPQPLLHWCDGTLIASFYNRLHC